MDCCRVVDVKGIMNLFKVDNLYFSSQPNYESLCCLKESKGVKKIVNLRSSCEMDFEVEKKWCEDLGLQYIELPLLKEGHFNFTNVKKLNDLICDDCEPVFIHCGSANRVAGWGITYLVEKKNVDFDEACKIAEDSGLTSFEFIGEARDYLESVGKI